VVHLVDRFHQRRHVHVVVVGVIVTGHLEPGIVLVGLPVEAEDHVVGVEVACRLEVLGGLPLHALAQVEGEAEPVLGCVPAAGEAGLDLRAAALEFDQSAVDLPRRRVEGCAGRVDRRIEVLGTAFRAIDQRFGGRGMAAGDGQGQGGSRRQQFRFHVECLPDEACGWRPAGDGGRDIGLTLLLPPRRVNQPVRRAARRSRAGDRSAPALPATNRSAVARRRRTA